MIDGNFFHNLGSQELEDWGERGDFLCEMNNRELGLLQGEGFNWSGARDMSLCMAVVSFLRWVPWQSLLDILILIYILSMLTDSTGSSHILTSRDYIH